jgi:hypothetical protein
MAERKDEVIGFAILLRALANGAAAIEYIAERDPEFFERSFAPCDTVVAIWPDSSSESGLGMLPVKRAPRVGSEAKSEVALCATREAAVALLKKFGDAKLQAEFADYLRPLN